MIRVLVVAVVAGTTLLGGALAPHDPTAPIAAPWTPPGAQAALGTDALGRDVLSRLLAGGRDLALVALVAAVVAAALGVTGGLVAGWAGRRRARIITLTADLLLALPLLLIAVVLAVALPGLVAVVAGTVCAGSPLTLRVVADATRQIRAAGYVEAALARGEPTPAILLREVLPALAGLAGADAVLRFVVALQLAAALGVLGFGPAPPTPDWAVMVRENLPGVSLNPAALVAPAAALAVLTLSFAAVTHSAARRGGGRMERTP
jgi:ABC-type dipeptide/oligopeptide/nickel transport system permease subunit